MCGAALNLKEEPDSVGDFMRFFPIRKSGSLGLERPIVAIAVAVALVDHLQVFAVPAATAGPVDFPVENIGCRARNERNIS